MDPWKAAIARSTECFYTILQPKVAIPGVGYLVTFKDTEGNIFGIMQNDKSAQ